MSYTIIDTDVWPKVVTAIVEERERRMHGLLRAGSMEVLRREQGFIDALDWVVAQSKPRPPERNSDEEC